jgi:hypothetical protein
LVSGEDKSNGVFQKPKTAIYLKTAMFSHNSCPEPGSNPARVLSF